MAFVIGLLRLADGTSTYGNFGALSSYLLKLVPISYDSKLSLLADGMSIHFRLLKFVKFVAWNCVRGVMKNILLC